MGFDFGDGLIAFGQGFMGSAAQQAADELKREAEMERQRALVEMRQQQIEWEHDKQEEWRREANEEDMGMAREIAGRRRGLIDPAEEAYRNAGMLDDPEVQRGLQEARDREAQVTTRDMVEARVQSGRMKPEALLEYDEKMAMLKDDKERRAEASKWEREFKEKQAADLKEYRDGQLANSAAHTRGRGQGTGGSSADKESALMAKTYTAQIKQLDDDKVPYKDLIKLEPEAKAEAVARNKEIDAEIKIMRNSALLAGNQQLRTRTMSDLAEEVARIEELPRTDGMTALRSLEAKLKTQYDDPLVNQMLTPFRPAFERIYRKNGGDRKDVRDARDRGARNSPGALSRAYTGE